MDSVPPRRHPRPPLAHGVAHRLPGGRGADPLPPRLPAHRRPQPDPRQRSRAGRHAPDRPQEPRHLRPLQHYSRAGTARGRRPTRRVSRATGAGGASPSAAPRGRPRRPAHRITPPPRATRHRVRARGPTRGRGAGAAGAGHRPSSVRCGSRPGHTGRAGPRAGPARDRGTRGDGVGRRGRTHARAGPRLGCRGRLRYQIETSQGAPPPHPCSNRNARMPLLGVIAAYAFTEDACACTVQERDRGVDGRSCITLLTESRRATSHRAAGGTGRDHGVAVRRWCADSARWASSGRHVDHRDRRRVMISM